MKKALIIGLSGLLFLFGTVSIAGATPITLIDTTKFTTTGTDSAEDLDSYGWGDVNKLDGIGNWVDGIGPLGSDYVTWTHNFIFDPAAAQINSAELKISFTDDDTDWLWWGFIPIDHELGVGWTEDGIWDIGEIDTGTVGPYSLNVDYVSDGTFSVTVASLGGDFLIDFSELTINYEPVPEPATMLLFGVGLVGLAGIHRKKRA